VRSNGAGLLERGHAHAVGPTRSAERLAFPAPRSIAPGTTIFRQCELASEVFFIETGTCKLVHHRPNVGDKLVGLRGPGFLAADAAILSLPYPVTAVSLSVCCISRLPAGRFRDLVRSVPEFSWQLHRMLSEELYLETGRVAELGELSARERLLQFLDNLHRDVPQDGELRDEVRVRVPLKQWEIAQLLAIAPPYLCTLIGQLEREGLLRRESDTFVLRRRSNGHAHNGSAQTSRSVG
jgi:CRP/FNR family transcriptional regulator, cyclic AMP receptor protein